MATRWSVHSVAGYVVVAEETNTWWCTGCGLEGACNPVVKQAVQQKQLKYAEILIRYENYMTAVG